VGSFTTPREAPHVTDVHINSCLACYPYLTPQRSSGQLRRCVLQMTEDDKETMIRLADADKDGKISLQVRPAYAEREHNRCQYHLSPPPPWAPPHFLDCLLVSV
jgi:hypothetical protein